jgi:hypothetical protein
MEELLQAANQPLVANGVIKSLVAITGSVPDHRHRAAVEASTAVPVAPAAAAGSRQRRPGCMRPPREVPAAQPRPPARQELGGEHTAAHSRRHVWVAGEGVTDGEGPLESIGTVGLGSGSRPGS